LLCRKQQGATILSLLIAASISLLLGIAILSTLQSAMTLWERQQTYSRAQTAFIWMQHHFDQRFQQAGDFGCLVLSADTPVNYPDNFPISDWATIAAQGGAQIEEKHVTFVWIEPAYYRATQPITTELLLYGAAIPPIATAQWWVIADAEGMEIILLEPQQMQSLSEGGRITHAFVRQFLPAVAIGRLHWVSYEVREQGLYMVEPWVRTQAVLTAPHFDWHWSRTGEHLGLQVALGDISWMTGWVR